jgi:hypothetical protein
MGEHAVSGYKTPPRAKRGSVIAAKKDRGNSLHPEGALAAHALIRDILTWPDALPGATS